MRVSLERMPFGEYLGAVAVTLDVDREVSGAELAHKLGDYLSTGVGCIWIHNAPWGQGWWRESLWEAQCTPGIKTYGRPWVVEMALDAEWPQAEAHWVCNASYLLEARHLTDEQLDVALQRAGLFPSVPDLVVRTTWPTVDPATLDAITRFVRPARPGQILASEIGPDMVKAVARCETPWILVPA